MALEQKIMEQLKVAMKSKDTIALESLRAIKSQLLLAKTSGSSEELSEKDEIALLQRLIKQRKEAAEQFENAGRTEDAEKEMAQSKVIAQFLPAQLSQEELMAKIEAIMGQVGATSIKDMGKVMGAANAQLAGKAAGKDISDAVKALLNN